MLTDCNAEQAAHHIASALVNGLAMLIYSFATIAIYASLISFSHGNVSASSVGVADTKSTIGQLLGRLSGEVKAENRFAKRLTCHSSRTSVRGSSKEALLQETLHTSKRRLTDALRTQEVPSVSATKQIPRGGTCQEDDFPIVPQKERIMAATQMKVLTFLSGGIAGTIGSSITNPLEVVKAQLQSSSASKVAGGALASAGGHPLAVARRIYEKDGALGFFRGLRPTLIGIIPARSAYFFTYEQTKRKLPQSYLPPGSTGNALLSGLAAGIAANTLTNPLWMIKTRMQLLADSSVGQRSYTSHREVVSTIARDEGIGGFYKGIFASYWGCFEGSIQFVLYERMKKTLMRQQNDRRQAMGLRPSDKLPKLTYFFSAAAAKCVASIATYPHEVSFPSVMRIYVLDEYHRKTSSDFQRIFVLSEIFVQETSALLFVVA